MIAEKQHLKQYEGFLKIPQLFSTNESLGVKSFETDEPVESRLNDDIKTELLKQKYLGKRAELYVLQYLKSSHQYSHITHSLQIQNVSTTIGEVDFICFDKVQQKWIHIELVSKLYVFTGEDDYDDLTQWIGPNLKDRLDFKIDKLKSHQLPLGKHQEVFRLIETREIESYCCYKAKLFLGTSEEKFNSEVLNKECIYGSYLNFEDFKNLKYSGGFFYVPDKADWFCDAKQHDTWYSFDKAETVLKPSIKDKRARLVWRKTPSGEFLEHFVVWW